MPYDEFSPLPPNATPREDVRLALTNFDKAACMRLKDGLLEKRLVRRHYVSADGAKGCPLHFLCGASTREQMIAYGYLSPEVFAACRRVIRWWDTDALDEKTLAEELAEAIRQRAALNAAEDATIHMVLEQLMAVAAK